MRVKRTLAQDAARVLGVELEGLSVEQLRLAYRAKAKAAHPDAGGDPDDFLKLGHARDILARWVADPPPPPKPELEPCMSCSGKGFILRQRGWRGLRSQCPMCKGRGHT